jgi:hypothetical protein
MPNITISGLPPATLPLDGPNSFFEVQTIEAGVTVSRKVAADDINLASAIVIEDEGVPLAGGADTLDFVGAGVVASGAGSTKTITIPGGGQVDSVVSGVNITIDATDPINPIASLDAAITGVSVNAVTLNAGGAATNYLDESGAYSVPAGAGGQVDSVVGGTNISVNAADPVNPIVDLDAAITGVSVNGVTLSNAGIATDFLNEEGNYVAAGGALPDPIIIGSINLTSALGVSSTGAPYDNVPINIGANLTGTMGMTQLSRQNIQTKPSAFSFNATLFININGAGTSGSDTIIGGLNSAQLEVEFGVGVHMQHGLVGTQVFTTAATGILLEQGSLFITEKAANSSPGAGDGEFWALNTAPNRPMFTNDTGGDQLIDPSLSEIISTTVSRVGILSDKGRTVGFTGANAGQTMTIPANGSVTYPIGTFLAWDNDGVNSFSIAITTDTLIFADDASTGTRTLAPGGAAVAQKIAATRWKIAGAGLS